MDLTGFDMTSQSHHNPLTCEYILISPHRAKRPWLGQVEPLSPESLPKYDPTCHLCPGNERSGGAINPTYTSIYTFKNDFAAMSPRPVNSQPLPAHELLQVRAVHGHCDVLSFHPRHDLTFARLALPNVLRIIEEWIRIYKERSLDDGIRYVQIFENKGSSVGCSTPHPHGQVWSTSEIPTIPAKELASMHRYAYSKVKDSEAPRGPKGNPCMLCEYAHLEVFDALNVRIVTKNMHWVAVVQWWATWPFEILLLPYRRHISSILQLSLEEKSELAQILLEVTVRMDNLFSCSFAYSMGIHQAPISHEAARVKDCEEDCDIAHFHFHFLPPLLRSATVRKFIAGFELVAEPQRDLTPEQAAERLRSCSTMHYADA